MFVFKKILGNLLMPLSFSLLLLLLGLALLWLSDAQSRNQFRGKLVLSLGVVILLLSSLPFSSARLSSAVERNYAPIFTAPHNLDFVVVLGGGMDIDPFLPPRAQLGVASYYRLMEGIRLIKANPRAILLVSGYGGSEPISNAQLYSMVAQEYGIARSRIRLFETPRDTQEEAALIAPIIKQGNSALVTSASHMRRAMGLFQALGANPLPAPVGFSSGKPQNTPYFYERLPRSRDLDKVTMAWHELLGRIWAQIRA